MHERKTGSELSPSCFGGVGGGTNFRGKFCDRERTNIGKKGGKKQCPSKATKCHVNLAAA